MLIYVDLNLIVAGVPKPLQIRHCESLYTSVQAVYGVRMAGTLNGDGEQWFLMRADISHSSPQQVIDFLTAWGIVAVTLEASDVLTFLGNTPHSLQVRQNLVSNPVRDITPSEIIPTLRKMELETLKPKPLTRDEAWVLEQPGQRELQEERMVQEMRMAGIKVPERVDLDWRRKQEEAQQAANDDAFFTRLDPDAWGATEPAPLAEPLTSDGFHRE